MPLQRELAYVLFGEVVTTSLSGMYGKNWAHFKG